MNIRILFKVFFSELLIGNKSQKPDSFHSPVSSPIDLLSALLQCREIIFSACAGAVQVAIDDPGRDIFAVYRDNERTSQVLSGIYPVTSFLPGKMKTK